MRLHLVAAVGLLSGLLHTPPVFEICAFHSQEHAGIFRRIFCKFGPESGKFMKEIWGASNRNSGRGQSRMGSNYALAAFADAFLAGELSPHVKPDPRDE